MCKMGGGGGGGNADMVAYRLDKFQSYLIVVEIVEESPKMFHGTHENEICVHVNGLQFKQTIHTQSLHCQKN